MWAAIAALVQAGGVLLGLLFVVIQLSQARRLRLDQTRPFVTVSFRQGTDRLAQFLWFEVTNVGGLPACNIALKFAPAAEPALADSGGYLDRFLRRTIRTLVPGATVSTLFDHGPERSKLRSEGRPVPELYAVKVSYSEPVRIGGWWPRRSREFEEVYDLDAAMFEPLMNISSHTVHEVALELEMIRKTMGKWQLQAPQTPGVPPPSAR